LTGGDALVPCEIPIRMNFAKSRCRKKPAYLGRLIEAMLEQYPAPGNQVPVRRAYNRANGAEPVVTAGAWLEMDPKTERFTNNPAANEMLRRADREPFVTPEIA